MAGSLDLRTVSREAGEDLSGHQYRFMYADTDSQLLHATGDTVLILGILQDDPDAAGKGALLGYGGIGKLVVDGNAGTITAGTSKLTSDAEGQGVVTTTNTKVYGAIALEGSTTAGDIIQVLITPGQMVAG